MKVMNEMQIQQVSGAGYMEDMGWKDFRDIVIWKRDNNFTGDLLSLGADENGVSEVREVYLQWCSDNGVDEVTSAKRNGWTL
ncbi:hypothetical protein [Pseudomonas graminis]